MIRTVHVAILLAFLGALAAACDRNEARAQDDAQAKLATPAPSRTHVAEGPSRGDVSGPAQPDEDPDHSEDAAKARDQTSTTGDPECERIVWRTRNIANLSGGAMQMIQVPECVPAKRD